MPERFCGIDFGLKKIGVAISSIIRPQIKPIAFNLITLNNQGFKQTAVRLEKIVLEYQITQFVIGWPTLPNGDEGAQCTLVNNFANKLMNYFHLPVHKQEEAYSTRMCQQLWDQFGLTAQVKDDFVAMYLLQSYLDKFLHAPNTL